MPNYFDMIYEKYDVIVSVFIASILVMVAGIVWAGDDAQSSILKHSCNTACEALGSKMAGQEGNLCVCEDLTTMRGEYRQLFLHGRPVVSKTIAIPRSNPDAHRGR